MKLNTIAGAAIAMGALCFVGCASRHEEGVTSNLRTQWTNVSADTEATTEAAEAVLNDRELKDVTSSSTAVDGKATGKMADGTKVNVAVQKETDRTSQVSVTVGTIGDPTLGAEMARAIKVRAEGGDDDRTTTTSDRNRDRATTRRSGM